MKKWTVRDFQWECLSSIRLCFAEVIAVSRNITESDAVVQNMIETFQNYLIRD
jgi:hypothetical protein